MSDAKLDPEVCRRLADWIGKLSDAPGSDVPATRAALRQAVAQLTAAAEMAERMAEIGNALGVGGQPPQAVAEAAWEASALVMTGVTVRAERDALRAQLAERPALTADEVRAVVLDAMREQQVGIRDADRALANLVAEKLAGRSLTAASPQVVSIGPADTAIIVEALEVWDRYLTAPHAEIARIRAALTGTVLS